MRSDIDKNEWIEAYLDGELSAEESAEVASRIQTDAEFARNVAAHTKIRELIFDSALLDIKKDLSVIHKNKVQFARNFRNLGLGFGGILMIVGIIYLVNPKNEQIQNNPGLIISETSDSIGKVIEKQDHTKTKTLDNKEKNKIEENTSVSVPPVSQKPITDNKEHEIITVAENKTLPEKQDTANMVAQSDKRETQKPKSVKDPCATIKINAVITSTESCNNSSTGSIIIDASSVRGGVAPYKYSINKTLFTDSARFNSLFSGAYTVYIKDAGNCIVKVGKIWVETVDCSYQAVFSPFKGETWEIPTKKGKSGEIKILNKTGSIVYKASLSGDFTHVWNGENNNRQRLTMGLYLFVITYTDGEVFSGNVTILE